MNEKFLPIKLIINDLKELSKDPENNKAELEELREILLEQTGRINSINDNVVNEAIESGEGSPGYDQFVFLKNEKEAYINNSKIIRLVKDRNYSEINKSLNAKENANKKEKKKRKKKRIVLATSIILTIGGAAVYGIISKNNKKENNGNEPQHTTQATMDDIYTERKTIEGTTAELTYTEEITEPTTMETTTEATTVATTAAPTTTEATTIGTTTENTTTATTAETTEASTAASTTDNTTQSTTETTTSETTETQTTEATTSETTTQDTETTETYTEAEQDTITEIFRTMKNDIIELYTSNEAKIAREKGKEYVVATIDFLFYGASINGITFKDLRSDAKEEIFEILQTMDSLIIHFDPDYKEEIGEKYNIVKNFAVEKYDDAKNKIIDKIGQEKYDEIISKKDEIFDKIIDTIKKYGGMALDLIKDKYEKWKNKSR